MIRFALNELKAEWKTWVGAACVILTASLVIGCSATVFSTWLSLRDSASQPEGISDVLLQLSVMVPALSSVSTIVVLSAVASAAVQNNRERYARWQLLGITPEKIRVILAFQLASIGLICAIAGETFAVMLSQQVIALVGRAITTATGKVHVPEASINVIVFGFALVFIVLVVLTSGLGPARRAAHVSVLEALRTPEPTIRTMTISRWITVGICIAATVGLIGSMFGNSQEIISLNTIFACITASGMISAAAPVVLPQLIKTWPRIIPDKISIVWTVARQAALHRVNTSAVSVTPLLVGITLIGAIFSAAYTERNAMLANSVAVERMTLAADQVIIMLGGPVILAVIGSAAIVFQGASARVRAAILLSRIGFRYSEVLRTAVTESLIYVGTALLTGLTIIAIIVSVESIALMQPLGPSWPTITVIPIALVAGFGAVILVFASVTPLLAGSRHR